MMQWLFKLSWVCLVEYLQKARLRIQREATLDCYSGNDVSWVCGSTACANWYVLELGSYPPTEKEIIFLYCIES